MRDLTFKRGLYPPHFKGTAQKETKVILPNKDDVLIYPMIQHIGAPCEPLVQVGERVLVGQKIADTKAFVSAPIHATVSGVVEKIAPSLMPNGATSSAIYIKTDAEMEEHPSIQGSHDYMHMSKEELLKVIREAGIVGLGGAGFPTHVKLNPPPDKKIDTVIVNLAECEPFLTTDHRVLLEETSRIILGIKVILSIFPNAKGVIGIETNKMDGLEKIENLCKETSNISIARLAPKYPQGAEKQLIYAITGREVPSGGLPADVGCIVQNVDTVIAIHRAIFRGRPIMRKIVTVAGGAVANPGNYKVRLGMRLGDLMNSIGGFKEPPHKLVAGGPMMGSALFSMDTPLTKLASGILAFTKAETDTAPERNCIRCGMCVSACPINLMPFELNQFAVRGERTKFKENNGMDCIECGCCSYGCPSKRHLVQSIRLERRAVLRERS